MPAPASQRTRSSARRSVLLGQTPSTWTWTAGRARITVLMGNVFGGAVLANHARTCPSQAKQYGIDRQLYADLKVNLQKLNIPLTRFGLPTWESPCHT